MKDMGEADIILGIKIKHGNKGIVIIQSHYIEKILKKFNRKDFSPVSTPMDPIEKLKPNTGKPVDQLEYSRAIGCLMYAMTSTKPDIAYVVGRLSRFTSNPSRQHWQAITRVFKYLKGTMNYGLSYVGYPSVLKAYSDASWINHVEDSSTTSKWVFLLGGGAISWAFKKQTCITGSTMESEFVALAAASKEAEWLRNLIHEIPIWSKPIVPVSIRCDSAPTMARAYSQIYNGKSRHLGARTKRSTYVNMKFCRFKKLGLGFLQPHPYFIFTSTVPQIKHHQWDYGRVPTILLVVVFFSDYEDVVVVVVLSSSHVNQVGDLSTYTTRFISPALTQKVFANMRQAGNGFSGVETPLFEGMLAARQLAEEGLTEEQVQADDVVAAAVEENVTENGAEFPPHIQQVLDVCSALTRHVKNLENDKAAQKLEIIKLKAKVKRRVENSEHDKAAQKLEIIKLKARVKRLERANKASRRVESSDDMEDVFNQGRMIDDLDKDEWIELVKDADIAETKGRHAAEQAKKQAEIYNFDLDHPSKVLSMQEDDSEVQEVVEVVTTSKLITDVVTAASQDSATSATISTANPSIPAAAPTVVAAYTRRRKRVIIRDPEEWLPSKTPAETPKLMDKGKGILVETPKPMKKKDQIELDAEYARKLHEEINKDHEEINKVIDWDAAIDHVNQKSKNPQFIKRYQGMKKRPQTESEARKNMMIYLKNTAGYKMDFFKGMSYAEICPIFQARFDENMRFLFKSWKEMEEEDQEVIKSINETPTQKAAKRRKLSEEAQEAKDLKKRLEVVDDEDDDVFIEATPLARKVHVVDYQIVLIDNKPRFKIIRADETHQLYISFITLLKNFDREDIENL
nr:zinc finger, CCHC-type [Tanacetum cinerariifolium]